MPLLQVRDFPEPLYRALELRAKKERRSISQQTIVFLDQALAAPQSNIERRKALMAEIDALHEDGYIASLNLPDVVAMIREDRER